MSDDSFIREVDEELRRDQARELWDRYGKLVIGVAVAIVLGTAGYRGWDYYQKSVAASSGDRFMEAVELSTKGEHDNAIALLDKLAAEGSGQYPALAKLKIASELAQRGDVAMAIENYDKIAADSAYDDAIQSVARVRAGLLAVDSADLEAVVSRLEGLAVTGGPFRHSAREGLGLANLKAGNLTEALEYFDTIANDSDASANIRERANMMLNLLAGKGVVKK